ncbi:mitochondrial metal transporter [Coniosporium tulheliwenetii]|uniref:Mitochondrial metal transporter n=2 Tax=Coniosporium tulheliwenetii TaxID=3383036 RepID=A0ACC2YI04_9PEZI|nr:mitochondrial metal transporter [Cladosporium sp. JES 115]KAJ9634932.1 mitochondrial metal transporter [Cladosporium sp. JES 115]
MVSVTQKREHAGHDHHHHDNVYLLLTDKNDPAARVTLLGLYSNIAIAIMKWVGGYYTHSHSLTADGWHSLGDTMGDLITCVALSFSQRLPNENFPTGYGKVEGIGALGVSGLLLYGGVEIGQRAIAELLQVYLPSVVELTEQWHVFGHIPSDGMNVVAPLAALIALGTVGVKAWVYFKTIQVANERKSSVLKGNAIHHLVDCWSGLAVFGAIGLGWLFPGVAAFDAIGGLVISLLVLKMGWSNFKMSLYELADIGVDEDIKAKVRRVAEKAVADINLPLSKETIELRQVQGVKSGQNYLMDLEIAAPSQWTLEQIRGVEAPNQS